ncbi:hypothetical protein DID88_009657 [Monilinia fructigena]|uniref:DNA-directed RNA polymerase n=1 Tax=Monilinia fructigena TaxID=38457 RepID=A0A395IMW2_9HELO|nr:hypothetical protein DID88_009657 [Monilinia fructigena]
MPPKKKATGPVEATPQATSAKKVQESAQEVDDPSVESENPKRKRVTKPTQTVNAGPIPQRDDDGFAALLEPFYDGKSLTDPISTAKDKWNLVPAFLKVKGLVKQHIDSFNYFVEHEIKDIVKANKRVTSEVDKYFWLEYTDIRVGEPERMDYDDRKPQNEITPNECRLRDMTYAAPIRVDIKYMRGRTIVARKNIAIGRMPIMLKSSKCRLAGKNDRQMAHMNECALDPGGYFIVNGTEKVILVQEQLSKNRVIIEADPKKGIVSASVTSSTHERKSKKLHHELLLLVAGSDERYQDEFSVNFEEATKLGVHTQYQALEYIGARVKMGSRARQPGQPHRRNVIGDALEALSNIIITHVPVVGLEFRPKALYICFMVRRVLMAMVNPKLVDDRDYVGNKRLELAGQLLSLLFEDLFKKFNTDLKMNIDKVLKEA